MVMSFLFDLIGGWGGDGNPFRGQMGATIHFLEEEKGGPRTDDGRNCSLLKLTSVYAGKLENPTK